MAERRVARLSSHLVAAPVAAGAGRIVGGRVHTLEEAAAMTHGTRITVAPGFPALYAEALRNIAYIKGIDFVPVQHVNMGIDKNTGKDRQARLYELTAQTSLPVMWHDTERPRSSWIEQLALCERIGKPGTPSMIPADYGLRAEMFGLCAVILGEDGLLWNRRLRADSALARKYGYSPEASAASEGKVVAIVKLIADRLESQAANGSKFLVGSSLTAADVYMATMSYNIVLPSEELLPKTKQNHVMQLMFGNLSPAVAAVVDKSRIVQHRDYIIKTFCEAGTSVGGDLL